MVRMGQCIYFVHLFPPVQVDISWYQNSRSPEVCRSGYVQSSKMNLFKHEFKINLFQVHSWVSAASASSTAEQKVISLRLFPLGIQLGIHAVETSVTALCYLGFTSKLFDIYWEYLCYIVCLFKFWTEYAHTIRLTQHKPSYRLMETIQIRSIVWHPVVMLGLAINHLSSFMVHGRAKVSQSGSLHSLQYTFVGWNNDLFLFSWSNRCDQSQCIIKSK